MAEQFDINQPIYQVGESTMSFSQMLNYFIDPAYQRGNLSRISDMHVKTGRPVSFRIDDDLTPMPGGVGVDVEVIKYMLGILLSEKHLNIVMDENEPEDVDTAFEWLEHGVNFRLNVFRDRDGLVSSCAYLPPKFLPFRRSDYHRTKFGRISPRSSVVWFW